MAPSRKGRKLDILRNDCRKLLSLINHQEIISSQKRRWLLGSTSDKDDQKKTNSAIFLPESLTRDDDVAFLNVKRSLQSNITPFVDTQQSNHIVVAYFDLFDQSMIEKPGVFLDTLSSALRNMTSSALENVALTITEDNDMSWTTRGAMKRVIKKILPKMFFKSKHGEHLKILKQLSLIFRNPTNFRNHLETITPVTPSLLSSVENAMQKLDGMSTQALLAMNRRLDDVAVLPQLRISITSKRAPLINKLQLYHRQFLLDLKEGDNLPKPFAKALSIVNIIVKAEKRQVDIPTTDFFPFMSTTEALQNDILMAIWSIPKVKTDELKKLKDMTDPDNNLPLKTFRSAIVKFLMEYLFECNEIEVPKSFLEIISFINRKSRRQLDFTTTLVADDEVEDVMNVSSQLKQILLDTFLDNADPNVSDAFMESLESDDGIDTDDFGDDIIIDGDVNYLGFAMEGMCDSESADCLDARNPCIRNTPARIGADFNDNQPCQAESGSESTLEYSSYHSIQSLCDGTGLLAQQLLDHVLERIPRTEPVEPGIGDDISSSLLVQAVEELVPSFPQGSLDKAKKLMGIS